MSVTGKLSLMMVVAAAAVLMAAGHPQSSGVLDLEALTNNLNKHFDEFQQPRHPRTTYRSQWHSSRAYVKQELEWYGYEVETQCFNTTVALEYDNEQEVTGCNVIAIHKGSSTKNVLVVGAHYDSSGEIINNSPLRDNGVGISVLLEVARAFEDSARWKGWAVNYTTIFVAFDLNTKEQIPMSTGHTGSYHFVNSWLVPKLQLERRVLGGSYILDSISTYNTDIDSQVIPADFKNIFPDGYERIKNDSTRGNFLAGIVNNDDQSKDYLKSFAGHYRMDKMARPYRLQELVAGPREFGGDDTLQMVNHQASFHFWTAVPVMPSVLLTDTGNKRMMPGAEDCSLDCNYQFANRVRMDFIYHTYRALTYTVLEKQATYVGLTESGSVLSSAASVVTVLVTAAASLVMARVVAH